MPKAKHSKLKWRIFPYKELAKATNNFDGFHFVGKRGGKRGLITHY